MGLYMKFFADKLGATLPSSCKMTTPFNSHVNCIEDVSLILTKNNGVIKMLRPQGIVQSKYKRPVDEVLLLHIILFITFELRGSSV